MLLWQYLLIVAVRNNIITVARHDKHQIKLTSNKVLVNCTVVLTNTKWLPPGKRHARMYNVFISQEKDKEQ